MPHGHIIALIQGTTNSQAIILYKKGEIISVTHREFEQIHPKSGRKKAFKRLRTGLNSKFKTKSFL